MLFTFLFLVVASVISGRGCEHTHHLFHGIQQPAFLYVQPECCITCPIVLQTAATFLFIVSILLQGLNAVKRTVLSILLNTPVTVSWKPINDAFFGFN
jgi:hypothetical protein